MASSVWNSAGTWEERDVSAWAKERLQALLLSVELEEAGTKITVKSVTKCTGDARVLFIRGKKRAGFEFHLALQWEATVASNPETGETTKASGTLVIDELSESSIDDFEVEVTVKSGPSTLKKSVGKLREKLQPLLNAFHEEMKNL